MARKTNPAIIGGFLVGAVILAVAGLVIFGGGKFFRSTQRWVAYFDESVKGLAIGAPVTFRGVKVGSVVDIKVVLDPKTVQVRTPVVFEIEANRITEPGGRAVPFTEDREGAKLAFEHGLRAQLELQSFVTGQLGINLGFHPNSPMHLVGGTTPYPECPTIPSTMAELGQSLNDLDVSQLGRDIRKTVEGAERLVNSPEVKQILVSAAAAMEEVNKLVANSDAKVTSLGLILEKTSANLNETLAAIRTLAQHVDSQTVPAVTGAFSDAGQLARRIDSETVPAANQLLGDAQQVARRLDAETVPAANQLLGEARQLAAQLKTTSEAARLAVEQVRRLATTVDTSVQDDSPMVFELKRALQEVSGAARSLRALAEYLDRHPEALLFGK
jgi:paraquat-inducible protein B